MENIGMNPKVNWFFEKDDKWHAAFGLLRTIILSCGLSEELKWGNPCYMEANSNIVLIHGFKEYCAVLFFKGALLKDTEGVLIQQTENVQVPRQMRFTNVEQVKHAERTLKAYVYEAIEVEKAGVKATMKKPAEFKMADEFKEALDKSASLKKAFEALTPGRQRGYLLHFSAPKQAKTRQARVDKSIPQIMDGKGLED